MSNQTENHLCYSDEKSRNHSSENRAIVIVNGSSEAEAETRAYWRAATPAERLNALEELREPFYGKGQMGGRLQRVLEVVPDEWDFPSDTGWFSAGLLPEPLV